MVIIHADHPFDFRPMQQLLHQIYKPKKPPDLERQRSSQVDTCNSSTTLESPPTPYKSKNNIYPLSERMSPTPDFLVEPVMACNLAPKIPTQTSKVIAMKTLSVTMSINSLSALMRMFWRQFHVVEIQSTHEEGGFLVLMNSHEDKRKVLEKRMWVMSNFLVLVEDWRLFVEMGKLCFRHAGFKIQLLNLPKTWHNEDAIRKALHRVGEVCQVSLFLGVPVAWVNMDLRMPFWPAVPIDYKGLKFWVYLAYDNLRNVCYSCGILGHYYKQCKFVKKPFACQFLATHGDFPYGKLCSRMKKFTGVNTQQRTPERFDIVDNKESKGTTQCMNGSNVDSDHPSTMVDAMDKIFFSGKKTSCVSPPDTSGKTCSENIAHKDVRESRSEFNPLPAHGTHLGNLERIPDTILRSKLVYGEPFSAPKSQAIFDHATNTSIAGDQGSRGVQVSNGQRTDDVNSETCPLSRMLLEGPYPITNFFSPQYCASVANLFLRKNAKLNLQVSLVNHSPSVAINFSCSKSTLKKYHRRERSKASQTLNCPQQQAAMDWVAPSPVAKRTKLLHSVDIDLDRQRSLEPGSDTPTTLKRKDRGCQLVSQDVDPEAEAANASTKQTNAIQGGEREAGGGEQMVSVDRGVQWNGWKLSLEEEIALSALSSGLRVGGAIHPSQQQ